MGPFSLRIGRRLLLALALAAFPAAALERLPALAIDPSATTVSGISSGAYMAVQMHVAHSKDIAGAGAFAGGPYYCAGGDLERARFGCMEGEPDAAPLARLTRDWARAGRIDPVENLARARVWLFSGTNDGVVRRPVTDALARYYEAFVPAGAIFYQDALPAGHAQVTLDHGPTCATTGGEFIVDCDYDGAGKLLQFLHGALAPKRQGALQGRLRTFDQREFIDGRPRSAGMAPEGYVFVPDECARGERCRLHVAFHGCLQQAERIGEAFVRNAGYNRWADANRIVVLYPQTVASWGLPFNPKGCWDWWGYTGADYATRDGVQVRAVKRMLERLGGGSPGAPGAAPAAPLAVSADAAVTAAAISWSAVPGADGYALLRARGGEPAAKVTPTPFAGLSFADRGLAADTEYRYEVVAVGGGQPLARQAVTVRTARTPPPCDPYFSDNVTHVNRGRAAVAWGRTYALGSGEPMGWWNVWVDTALRRDGGVYRVGACP
jgi:poly(3-hydroxybutyrate) depolymerase